MNLGSFTLLPQHVVRLILAREELRADEFTKFQAALMWSKKYCDSNQNTPLKEVIGNFLEYIQFHKIPANVLMREVHPLGIVPYSIIMNALAFQVGDNTWVTVGVSVSQLSNFVAGRPKKCGPRKALSQLQSSKEGTSVTWSFDVRTKFVGSVRFQHYA